MSSAVSRGRSSCSACPAPATTTRLAFGITAPEPLDLRRGDHRRQILGLRIGRRGGWRLAVAAPVVAHDVEVPAEDRPHVVETGGVDQAIVKQHDGLWPRSAALVVELATVDLDNVGQGNGRPEDHAKPKPKGDQSSDHRRSQNQAAGADTPLSRSRSAGDSTFGWTIGRSIAVSANGLTRKPPVKRAHRRLRISQKKQARGAERLWFRLPDRAADVGAVAHGPERRRHGAWCILQAGARQAHERHHLAGRRRGADGRVAAGGVPAQQTRLRELYAGKMLCALPECDVLWQRLDAFAAAALVKQVRLAPQEAGERLAIFTLADPAWSQAARARPRQ